jgi:hypothetical protein
MPALGEMNPKYSKKASFTSVENYAASHAQGLLIQLAYSQHYVVESFRECIVEGSIPIKPD